MTLNRLTLILQLPDYVHRKKTLVRIQHPTMQKTFLNKKFGIIYITNSTNIEQTINDTAAFVKIIYLPRHTKITLDFQDFQHEEDSLFFVSNTQQYQLPAANKLIGAVILYFNQDFYCVQIHDKEVSCDGILFNNVFNAPSVVLAKQDNAKIVNTIKEVKKEYESDDIATEEMLRILLKKIIITATRIYKKQKGLTANNINNDDINFLRKFSQLVEIHFYQSHAVANYADMLHITSKNLNKKINAASTKSPSQIIKDRLLLEAKRYLTHTNNSVKEIAYKLGYEDEAYFNRFFTLHSKLTPSQFRKSFQNFYER